MSKQKLKVLTEKELKEKMGLEDNKIRLILSHQERFPELLENKSGFCINARNLHEQLHVGAEYTTWIKRRIRKYKFEENVDFTSFDKSVKAKNTYINTKEYLLTLNMAKELCMVENNDIGLETRKYFMVMEETLKNYENWEISRVTEKIGWNDMTQCIEDWCIRKGYDYTLRMFYIREANLLNTCLLNHTAIEINTLLNNKDEITRNHLTQSINDALNFLQQLNCSLLMSDLDFESRSKIIKTTCENKYSDLKEIFNKLVA
jgi:phage anti-repressor protein